MPANTEAELRALLPAPETLLAYADMMLKPYRDIRGGMNEPSEISHACANALRLAALIKTKITINQKLSESDRAGNLWEKIDACRTVRECEDVLIEALREAEARGRLSQ